MAERQNPGPRGGREAGEDPHALQAVPIRRFGLSVIDLDLIREVQFTPEEGRDQDGPDDAVLPLRPDAHQPDPVGLRDRRGDAREGTVLPDRWEPPPGCAELASGHRSVVGLRSAALASTNKDVRKPVEPRQQVLPATNLVDARHDRRSALRATVRAWSTVAA